MENSRRRFPWHQVLVILFYLISGILCGYLAADHLRYYGKLQGFWPIVLNFSLLLVELYLAMFCHTVIHELGHLFFGFLSGYRFCSFRVGPYMFVKIKGRLRLRNLSLTGTGGQCLMCPPDMKEGKLPVVLYNLGGSILNFMVAALCLMICMFMPWVRYVSEFSLMCAVIGFAYALSNGVPMRMGIVDNDGYNAISLGRNPTAMRAWWIQLKANNMISQGIRIKDMPAKWFEIPDEEGLRNSITATLGVFACNRLIDEHRFSEAIVLMEKLLSMDIPINGLHRSLLIADCIYCELVGNCDPDKLEQLRSKQQRRFERSMAEHPSILRTRYCWALLHKKDSALADKFRWAFRKRARFYPYPCEIEAERELMKIATEKAAWLKAEKTNI